MRASRLYFVNCTSGGFRVEVARTYWRSSARIRQFCVTVFRKYFGGRSPSFHWGKDGFMAEAWDRSGNRVSVEQQNWWDCFAPGSTFAKRPLCPVRKEAK